MLSLTLHAFNPAAVAIDTTYLIGVSRMVECCHQNSKELHVCLNNYLAKGSRQESVNLEDFDLNNLCKHGITLHDCYKNILSECNSNWQMERFSRLMHLLQATHSYLCSNNSDTLKHLFVNDECKFGYSLGIMSNCPDETGLSLNTTWQEILRMQVTPADRCSSMDAYRRACLVDRLQYGVCGQEGARVFGGLMNVWLGSWCNNSTSFVDEYSTPSVDEYSTSSVKYLYQPLTFIICYLLCTVVQIHSLFI